jgi:acetyl esterase/lipase
MTGISRRSFGMGGAAAAIASVLPKALWAAAPATPDLSFVAPELRDAARGVLAMMASRPPISLSTLDASRKVMGSFSGPPLAAPAFEQRLVKRTDGASDVVVYVINAKANGARPAILHTHGGGFVVGSARSGIADLQALAAELDCVIVTVEYRLAPETPFAGSMEDNYTALRWLYTHAAELGASPQRIAVMGESAGGGHAALLALTARDRGEIPLVFQLLIYPMLDDRTGTTRQPPAPIGTLLWTPELNRFGWRSFLGQEPASANVAAKAVPARYANLAGLPPTFIGVGSIDLFVDEDIDYARRLIDAGVPTQLLVVPGAFHGFDSIAPRSSVATSFTASKVAALRRAFAATAP